MFFGHPEFFCVARKNVCKKNNVVPKVNFNTDVATVAVDIAVASGDSAVVALVVRAED